MTNPKVTNAINSKGTWRRNAAEGGKNMPPFVCVYVERL